MTTMRAKRTSAVLDQFNLTETALPKGVERTHVTITRDSATLMLDANESNRRLRMDLAKTYARMMLAPGGWPYVGDPIRIDKNGRIIDGQHRIKAVEICGVALEVDIITGLEPEVQNNIDGGTMRKPADNLRMAGFTNTQTMAAGARFLMYWGLERAEDTEDAAWTLASETFRPAMAEITAYALDHPGLEQSASVAYNTYMATHVRPGIATALHYRMSLIDAERAEEFFTSLRTGVDMAEGNPVLTWRNRLSRVRRDAIRESPAEHLFHGVNTWNKWVAREANLRVMPPRDGVGPGSTVRLSDTILLVDGEKWTPRKGD